MQAIRPDRVCCGSRPLRASHCGRARRFSEPCFPMSCKESRRAFLHQSGCGLLTLAAMGLGGDAVLPVSAIAGAGTGKEKTYAIPPADGVNIDRSSAVMIVRYANHVYA